MTVDEEGAGPVSPMHYNGGLQSGDPAPVVPVYDGGPGFGPGGAGRAYHAGHPPVDCPNPRIMTSVRGLYRCPACGGKVRLAGHRSGTDIGYDIGDAVAGAVFAGIGLAWQVAWPSLITLARAAAAAAAWTWHRITRPTAEENDQENTDDPVVEEPGTEPERRTQTAQRPHQGDEEETPDAPDSAMADKETEPVLTCPDTTDAQHVPAWKGNSYQCLACTTTITANPDP